MKAVNRFWSTETNELREIRRVARDKRTGDILLALDGGELWQFTPYQNDTPTPAAAAVKLAGRMTITSSPHPHKIGTFSPQCLIHLHDGSRMGGNLRKFTGGAATARMAQAKAPKERRRRGAPTQYTAKELRDLERAIAANNGSLIDTAKEQSPGDWESRYRVIKRMRDAARKQGLTARK